MISGGIQWHRTVFLYWTSWWNGQFSFFLKDPCKPRYNTSFRQVGKMLLFKKLSTMKNLLYLLVWETLDVCLRSLSCCRIKLRPILMERSPVFLSISINAGQSKKTFKEPPPYFTVVCSHSTTNFLLLQPNIFCTAALMFSFVVESLDWVSVSEVLWVFGFKSSMKNTSGHYSVWPVT